MKDNVEFLNNFLFKELLIVEEPSTMQNFINNNFQNFVLVCENKSFAVGDYVIFKRNCQKFHIVKPNETINLIAQKYNISEQEIINKNSTTKIFIGQQLKIK